MQRLEGLDWGRPDKDANLHLSREVIAEIASEIEDRAPGGAHLWPGVRSERFRKIILQEFYRVAFRKKVYRCIAELQADLDEWMAQ